MEENLKMPLPLYKEKELKPCPLQQRQGFSFPALLMDNRQPITSQSSSLLPVIISSL